MPSGKGLALSGAVAIVGYAPQYTINRSLGEKNDVTTRQIYLEVIRMIRWDVLAGQTPVIAVNLAQVHAENFQGLNVAMPRLELFQKAPQPIAFSLFPKEATADIHRLDLAVFLGQFRNQDATIKPTTGQHAHRIIAQGGIPLSHR